MHGSRLNLQKELEIEFRVLLTENGTRQLELAKT